MRHWAVRLGLIFATFIHALAAIGISGSLVQNTETTLFEAVREGMEFVPESYAMAMGFSGIPFWVTLIYWVVLLGATGFSLRNIKSD